MNDLEEPKNIQVVEAEAKWFLRWNGLTEPLLKKSVQCF